MTALISLAALERADDTDTVTARASASDVEAERARDLAARAATGDPVATRQLLTLVTPAVVRSARLVLGSKSPDVEDVTQQALMAFVEALPSFRGECHPSVVACGAEELADATERRRVPHDDAGTAAYQRRCVRDLLARLPRDQAEVMALHVVLGYSLPEVSQSTSIPLNTVKSRLRLAKQALRRHLDAECPSS